MKGCQLLAYFTKGEWLLWGGSMGCILVSFLLFDRSSILTLVASLVGTTSLIFCAKGNPIGPLLSIVFSCLYGYISYTFAYYGEMITYLGMTAPMAVVSLVTWLRNPFQAHKAEVRVNQIGRVEVALMLAASAVVTVAFYFILAAFHTANLIPSTISVLTSFLAVYLTFRRSPWYAIAYAANDLVLILLWILAAASDPSYFSVVICFAAFLINDIYGYISWSKMRVRQQSVSS